MKTTIRKILTLVLIAAICTSFAACNHAEQDPDGSDNVSNNPLVNVSDGDDKDDEGSGNDGESADDESGSDENSEENDTENNDDSGQTSDEAEDTTPEESDTTAAEESTSPEDKPDSDAADDKNSEDSEKEDKTETTVIATEKEQQPAPSGKGDAIAQTAESVVGYDYLYGGDSPEDGGFDNSGLVYYALTKNGIACPRTTKEIMKIGSEVSYDELRRGDVVLFKMDDGSNIVFGGVYVGEGKAVMSFSEGIPVKIADVATNYYRSTFLKGLRVSE